MRRPYPPPDEAKIRADLRAKEADLEAQLAKVRKGLACPHDWGSRWLEVTHRYSELHTEAFQVWFCKNGCGC